MPARTYIPAKAAALTREGVLPLKLICNAHFVTLTCL